MRHSKVSHTLVSDQNILTKSRSPNIKASGEDVSVVSMVDISHGVGLSRGGLLCIAVLVGGDYDQVCEDAPSTAY